MDFVLFRHAKKGFTPFEDPHLSEDGFRQSDHLPQTLIQLQLPVPTELWVSEKIRTSQTFRGLANEYKIPMTVRPELNVRGDQESGSIFSNRVHKMIDEISVTDGNHTSKVVYACSHYDWIEEAMLYIRCDKNLKSFEFSHWAPAQFIHFRVTAHATQWAYVKKGVQK